MRKLAIFIVLFFGALIANAQMNTTRQTTKLFDRIVGSKTAFVPTNPAVVFGGKVYDSLIVTIPYGTCPLFLDAPHDSTAIRYGSHGISVQVTNDSTRKDRPDSVYVVMTLNFLTSDGGLINSGKILEKKWIQSANSTFNIDPADVNYKTYMMRQEYFQATLTIRIYMGYPRTLNNVRIYKYFKNNKG